jgi:hypothetical protein
MVSEDMQRKISVIVRSPGQRWCITYTSLRSATNNPEEPQVVGLKEVNWSFCAFATSHTIQRTTRRRRKGVPMEDIMDPLQEDVAPNTKAVHQISRGVAVEAGFVPKQALFC